MRYGSKQDLIDDIRREHDALEALLQGIPEARETPRLNRDVQARHHARPLAEVREDFKGFRRILELVEELPEEALLSPGHFSWTGKYSLTTYLPNTASHYRFAMKVLRRWLRGETRGGRG